ncbi:MAG: hypothetical protein LWX55_15725 [Deltaproteobacteria bacterium]|jgi:hypothetical protein|nr:hypothetical protein [Deltaproteobacteria bacterium]
MHISIETHDTSLAEQLYENLYLTQGNVIELPGNGNLVFDGTMTSKGLISELPSIFEFTLSFAGGAASSLIANWLYEKLKGRKVTTVSFDRKEVQISKDGFERRISESIKLEQK